MRQNRKIIITGASGFIGQYLCRYFAENSFTVFALARTKPAFQHPAVSFIPYELGQPIAEDLFKEASCLVHAAFSYYSRRNKKAYEINQTAMEDLLSHCEKHDVKMVFLSSFSAHENALSSYGRAKFANEKMIDVTKHVILKLGLVVGEKGLFADLARGIQLSPIIPLIGLGEQPFQLIHIDDVVHIIHKVCIKPLTGVFCVAQNRVYSFRDLCSSIARPLEKRVLFLPIPYFVLYFILAICEWLPFFSFSTENLKGLRHAKSIDTQKDLAHLGLASEILKNPIDNQQFQS